MASGDNTTEYKVKVTADTGQAEENIQDLGDKTDDTSKKFKSLKTQIRETTVQLQELADAGKVGTKEFERLRSKLDDLNDAQDRVNYQAGQFDDKLAALPGPIGQVGQALQGFNESMVKFGKSTMIALGVVGLIITAFMTMKESLESTAEGQALLTRLTGAFQKVLGPLLAIVEKVAIPVFEGLAFVLEKVASGLASAAEWMGISSSKIAEASSGVKDFKKVAEDAAKAQKEAAEKAAADKKAADEKAKAAREKAAAEAKARREKAAAEQAEFDKARVQAAIELLDGQEKEQAALAVKYAEDRLKFKGRSAKDLAILDEAYQKQRTDIDKKYEDERLAKLKKDQEEEAKGLDEEYKKQEEIAADKRALTYQTIEEQIGELDRLNQKYDTDFQADRDRLEQKKLKIAEERELALTNTKLTEAERLKVIQDAAQKERDIDKEVTASKRAELDARKALQLQYIDAVQQVGSILSSLAGENKDIAIAGLLIEQAAAVARITVNTLSAASTIASTSPLGYLDPRAILTYVSGGLSVVQAGIATAKGIEQIRSANANSAGGGGSVGGAPSIQAPRVGTAATPQMAEGVGANPSTQIAQTIGNAQNQPVRAYVVSQDITSQQQLDRKVNAAAVF